MKKLRLCMLILLLSPTLCANSWGQSLITASGGITFEKTYNVEVGYHYVFFRHVAVGASVGCWAEYSDNKLRAREMFDGVAHHLSRPYLKPSLMLFTPPFVNLAVLRLKLGVEGSAMFSPRFRNTLVIHDTEGDEMLFNYRSRAVSWGAAAWLQAEVFKVIVGLGYSATSLELNKHFSATPRTTYDDYPQGIFARVGLYF